MFTEVEHVQRKVTKCIRGFSDLSYPERLRQLNLPTLQTRRQYFDMLECYKIVHGMVLFVLYVMKYLHYLRIAQGDTIAN